MMLLRWIDGAPGSVGDDATAANVRHQQVALLYQASQIGLIVGMMAVIVICLVFWDAVPAFNLLAWALACTAITAVRVYDLRAYRRDTQAQENALRWLRRFVGAIFVHGVILSGANFFIFPDDPINQLLLIIVIIGIASGGAIILTAHLPSSVLYTTSVLAPLAVRFMIDEDMPFLFGPMTIVYIGLLVSTSLNFTQVLTRLLGLQNELHEVIRSKELAEEQLKTHVNQLDSLNTALSLSEARQRAIIENAPFGIAVRDLDGRHVVANSKYFDIFDPPGGDIVGQTLEEAFPTALADRQREIDHLVNQQRRTVVQETEYQLPSGTGHFLEVSFPIFDAGENLSSIGSLAVDITDRIQLEERLRQSQKMEAIGGLTGGVAHEFNNLLMVIRGNLELISGGLGDDNRHLATFVERSLRGVDRGADLTQRLLSFARRHPVQPQIVDLNDLVTNEIPMLEQALGEKWRIVAKTSATPAQVRIDPRQVEQSILNLVINARDALSDGGEIEIAVERRSMDAAAARELDTDLTPGPYVVLSVSDSGAGMDQAVQLRVFEPFFTTKDVGDGTGLGLSMVYGFAKQSSGHADIESAPDAGTTVRLFLPALAEEAVPDTVVLEVNEGGEADTARSSAKAG